jgi:hypothetical protein
MIFDVSCNVIYGLKETARERKAREALEKARAREEETRAVKAKKTAQEISDKLGAQVLSSEVLMSIVNYGELPALVRDPIEAFVNDAKKTMATAKQILMGTEDLDSLDVGTREVTAKISEVRKHEAIAKKLLSTIARIA